MIGVILFLQLPLHGYAETKYEKRMESYKNKWQDLIPTHAKIQFAGSMGLFSTGIGWDYGKHNQWETDVLIGIIPSYTTKAKTSFTIKQNYMPWNISLGKDFVLEPLACGLYFNTVLDKDFWVKEPDRYPKGYYNFSTKIRTNIFIGQRLTCNLQQDKQHIGRAITFFYEISTSDLYIVSAFGNNYLRPEDYLHLSLGIKLQIL